MATEQDIKHWIEMGLPNSKVAVEGDGHHFSATIICPQFAGKSTLERHRMVYDVLGDRMKSEIHALSLRTYEKE